jgi:hypothetical protein
MSKARTIANMVSGVTSGIQATRGIGATYTNAAVTGSTTLDFVNYENFVLTLTGVTTLANPTSVPVVGQSGFIAFIQDATGSRTVSLGTDFETAGNAGVTLSSTASSTTVVPYVMVAANRIVLGSSTQDVK